MDNTNNKSSNKTSKRLSWKSVIPIVLVSTVVSSGISAGIAYAFAKGFSYDVPKFTATFKNWDGTVLATVTDIQLGEKVVVPEEAKNPTRPSHVEGEWIEWTFSGWDNDINASMIKDMTFTAQYSGVHDKYTAKFFKNATDINPIDSCVANKGEEPNAEFVKEMSEQCKKDPQGDKQFAFSGWDIVGKQGDDEICYYAHYDGENRGFNFRTVNNSFVIIDAFDETYLSTTSEVIIPATWGGLPVTKIGEKAFSPSDSNGTSISSITIPASISEIGEGAFKNCTSLQEIIFNDSDKSTLQYINKETFSNTHLSTITLPNSVTCIYEDAFNSCGILEEINLGANVSEIAPSFFRNCGELKTIKVDKNNETYKTYENKVLLKTIAGSDKQCIVKCVPQIDTPIDFTDLGDTVGEFADNAFEGCLAVETVDLSDCKSLNKLGSSCFKSCPNLTSVKLNDAITQIPDYCFADCLKLESFTFGKGINWSDGSIVASAFDNDTKLENIYVVDGHPSLAVENGILYDINKTTLLRCPPNKDLGTITIPESVTTIGAYSCKWNILENIVIPNHVTKIERNAFDACSKLKTFNTGDGVTSIGEYALSNCIALEELTLGAEIKYSFESMNPTFLSNSNKISKFVVSQNNPVLSVVDNIVLFDNEQKHLYRMVPNVDLTDKTYTIPESVLSIEAWAFKNVNIEHLVLNNNPNFEYIDTEALGTKSLKTIEIKNHSKAPLFVPDYETYTSCFDGADVEHLLFIIDEPSLYSKVAASWAYDNLKSIYKAVNADSEVETKLNIQLNAPDATGKIENDVLFKQCQYLKSISFGDNVKQVMCPEMFRSCPNLETIKLPDGLTYLPNNIFSDCINLGGEIVAPSTLTNIPNGFIANSQVTSFEAKSGVQKIDSYAFTGCSLLTDVKLPNTITSILTYAFQNCTSLHKIIYDGTKSDWQTIDMGSTNPFIGCSNLVVQCTDGELPLM